ncbi:alpha/beta-type small acid-soluble spore protein [Alicyclobacillus acidocaldarius]|uniref:Small acid-soluble spore protein alpha/beta type n=1 Tax=Alicyclobacillus acidocaldarius subsp. acidocaldarius (strain ATCC 27009 / DSM 446 / BCRC 14685 / JCM 5260 / KCTC 1825 / NBRC 15652 / NCIMB 11725 / NRRL B-14509 / 104-IA) TaxID=521098 RepID=C8WR60_ALIAD|nr:alpha/beta-type small acid-soluble spore protein [Alicyclobacillus acidocaldarius]ACV59229.1 small acid-soluble spore protein alpha/beta type [Alicyclobacillus acidocaldarius subsp. acidocaldarius DSM 446]
MAKSNRLLLGQASRALQDMKYEIAGELGITPPADGYWGFVSSYENGSIGGSITKRLVRYAQERLAQGDAGSP